MPKLLADFLHEQQEPFALEIYLVERSYPKRLTLHNSAKYVAPNCSYFVRALFSQFVAANMNGGRRIFFTEKSKTRRENAGQDGIFSAASTTSLPNSSSESEAHCSESVIRRFVKCGNCFLEGEGEGEIDDADTNSKLRAVEDGKQLSPVSVLGEADSDQDSPIHYREQSECRLKQAIRYDQYTINKTALQQRKQLLIDCTQEVIEKYRKNRDDINGAEEIWKHICENVRMWSQDSITQSNILHLLHSDFLASADEWNAALEQHKFEISIDIENTIFDNVINEIVTC